MHIYHQWIALVRFAS